MLPKADAFLGEVFFFRSAFTVSLYHPFKLDAIFERINVRLAGMIVFFLFDIGKRIDKPVFWSFRIHGVDMVQELKCIIVPIIKHLSVFGVRNIEQRGVPEIYSGSQTTEGVRIEATIELAGKFGRNQRLTVLIDHVRLGSQNTMFTRRAKLGA